MFAQVFFAVLLALLAGYLIIVAPAAAAVIIPFALICWLTCWIVLKIFRAPSHAIL